MKNNCNSRGTQKTQPSSGGLVVHYGGGGGGSASYTCKSKLKKINIQYQATYGASSACKHSSTCRLLSRRCSIFINVLLDFYVKLNISILAYHVSEYYLNPNFLHHYIFLHNIIMNLLIL